jgi:hypothetical protein
MEVGLLILGFDLAYGTGELYNPHKLRAIGRQTGSNPSRQLDDNRLNCRNIAIALTDQRSKREIASQGESVFSWWDGLRAFCCGPLRMLRPQWAMITKHIGALGLAVALLAALALLLEPPVVAESESPK